MHKYAWIQVYMLTRTHTRTHTHTISYESVDSVCRNTADTQYNYANTQNQKMGSLHDNVPSSSSVFLAKKTPSVVKNHHKSIEPESCQNAKIVFFFLKTGLFKIAGRTLTPRFSNKTAVFYTEQCTTPPLFKKFEVSRGA